MLDSLDKYKQNIEAVKGLIDIIPNFLVDNQKIKTFSNFGKEFHLILSDIDDLNSNKEKLRNCCDGP